MAFTQTDIDTLDRAIASGTLTVSYGGPPARSVTYQSLDSMLKARAVMRRQVDGNTSSYRLGATKKGLGE